MDNTRYQQAKKITLIGAIINAILGALKLVFGTLFHSHSLVADGFHSFSDLITDVMVVVASRYGNLEADETHPYGHQRFETAATLLLALLLILTGFGIAWDALSELIDSSFVRPLPGALPIAIFSIIANEALFHYTRHVGRKIQSSLILANAWHHRSDAASSIVVALGLTASLLGFTWVDILAAIIIGIMIIQMGLKYGWNSVKELVDTALDPKTLSTIEDLIQEFPGVEKIHQLRSRLMGGDILIDVHILVASYISVSEGHYIAQHVHHTLMRQFPRIKDVTVHVDPEDDEKESVSEHLPSRETLEQAFLSAWKQQYPIIQSWTLHYLKGQLIVDLLCLKNSAHLDLLKQTIKTDLSNNSLIASVRLFCIDDIIINLEKAC